MQLTATIRQEGHLFVAQCVEIDVASQGESEDTALDNLREAVELYLEDDGAESAPPRVVVKTFEVRAQ